MYSKLLFGLGVLMLTAAGGIIGGLTVVCLLPYLSYKGEVAQTTPAKETPVYKPEPFTVQPKLKMPEFVSPSPRPIPPTEETEEEKAKAKAELERLEKENEVVGEKIFKQVPEGGELLKELTLKVDGTEVQARIYVSKGLKAASIVENNFTFFLKKEEWVEVKFREVVKWRASGFAEPDAEYGSGIVRRITRRHEIFALLKGPLAIHCDYEEDKKDD